MRYNAKVDANQKQIVLGLRAAGCSVFVSHRVGHGFPDLVVGRGGVTYLLEVKYTNCRLTKDEREFHENWLGHVSIVSNLDQALKAVGLL